MRITKMVVDNNCDCEKCNHNLNDKNHTLRILPKRIMTVPPTLFCVCDLCNRGFKFIQNEDGQYIEE